MSVNLSSKLYSDIIPVALGGTGATSASTALIALGAQPMLVSGTHIVTINNTALIGSGNIVVKCLFPTAVKTSTYNPANSFELIRCSSLAGTFSITLPLSPNDGDFIGILDVTNSFSAYPVTILPNGKTIESDTSLILNINGSCITLVYENSTTNWKLSENLSSIYVNVPQPPTSVTAVAGNNQSTVSFTAPADTGGASITSYTVTSSPSGITATGAASPITVTGLSAATSYTFTVTATNANLITSVQSTASNSITTSSAPGAPTIGTATATSATTATVAFTAPASNGGSPITSYTATSSPGGITGTLSQSGSGTITVTGLSTTTSYTFTVTATNAVGTSLSSGLSNSVTPAAVPPVAGYIGWYTGLSFAAGSQWTDLSGNGNHATSLKGSPAVQTQSAGTAGNSQSITTVYGNTGDGILWPSAILPSTYTLFHVARQTSSSSRGRIFTGATGNWLSGFWSGATGCAYHEGWMTNYSTDTHGLNWFVSSDQNSLYRSAGVQRGTGGGASTQLSILNGNFSGEVSYWAVAEIIVYNTTLTLSQIQSVESYLSTKYGL